MGFFKTLFTGKEDTEEEKVEQKKESDFNVFKYDGIQAFRMGQFDYAIACFERALDIHDDCETQRYYANALLSKNDIEGAIEEFELLLNDLPDDMSIKVGLADLYFQTENYDKMTTMCDEVMKADDSLGTPHYLMAKMHHAQKDYINAVAQATLAISKSEDFDEAYLLRSQILFEMQQYEEAEKDIDVILAKQPENDEVLMMKAGCLEIMHKDDEAKETYRKVISLNPFIHKAYIQLGGILMREGNKTEAAKVVEEGLAMNPEEMKEFTGEYTNWEAKMRESLNALNPYQLGVHL